MKQVDCYHRFARLQEEKKKTLKKNFEIVFD